MMRLIACLWLVLASGILAAANDQEDPADKGSRLMTEERIGELRIGLPGKAVGDHIACPVKRGPKEYWAASGDYHSEWTFPGCGITLDMASESKTGAQKVAGITIKAPSDLSTREGIRIGSTEPEVAKAYAAYRNQDESERGASFVAGSVFGGVVFTIKNGKVTEIFIGAAAE